MKQQAVDAVLAESYLFKRFVMIQLERPRTSISTLSAPKLLIATCKMDEGSFKEGVVLVYQHNKEGSLGLMINRPLEITLGSIFDQLNIQSNERSILDRSIFLGGPLDRNQGLILCVDSSSDKKFSIEGRQKCLEDIAKGKGPKNFLIALGHAAWGPLQLDKEIEQAYWIERPVDIPLLFEVPAKDRWKRASSQLGFDMRTMAHFSGHD